MAYAGPRFDYRYPCGFHHPLYERSAAAGKRNIYHSNSIENPVNIGMGITLYRRLGKGNRVGFTPGGRKALADRRNDSPVGFEGGRTAAQEYRVRAFVCEREGIHGYIGTGFINYGRYSEGYANLADLQSIRNGPPRGDFTYWISLGGEFSDCRDNVVKTGIIERETGNEAFPHAARAGLRNVAGVCREYFFPRIIERVANGKEGAVLLIGGTLG
jgi:hypothetical protein